MNDEEALEQAEHPGAYGRPSEDCVFYLLGLIPLTDGNELKDAVANALKEKTGAVRSLK